MATQPTTILDRLWLWGMKVNALQDTDAYGSLGFAESKWNTEGALQRTGIRNVYMAGGLEIDEESLAAMPSAKRIVCKWALHTHHADNRLELDFDGAAERLLAAKRLAASDARIDGFLLDDYSTGSIEAGASPEVMARLQYLNATTPPHLPMFGTIYTMSLEREGLADLLRYFDQLLVPLWHAPEIDTMPERIERCAELSGNKPMLACLYFYDFGNGKPMTAEQMQHQLDVVEPLVRSQRMAGMLFCGTCMMDIGWESVECLYEWIDRVGADTL